MARPYLILAALIGLIAIAGGTFAKGASWGRTQATARCQADKIEAQQREIVERAALQAAIDQRDAELQAKEQEIANAVINVRTEYLPARTIVKRQIVERAVYRDCRADDSLWQLANAALRGDAAAGAEAFDRDTAGVPGVSDAPG